MPPLIDPIYILTKNSMTSRTTRVVFHKHEKGERLPRLHARTSATPARSPLLLLAGLGRRRAGGLEAAHVMAGRSAVIGRLGRRPPGGGRHALLLLELEIGAELLVLLVQQLRLPP